MSESKVLYDISRGAYQWIMPGFGLIFVAVSIVFIMLGKFIYKDYDKILDPSRERLFFNLYHPIHKNAFINIPKFILVFSLESPSRIITSILGLLPLSCRLCSCPP